MRRPFLLLVSVSLASLLLSGSALGNAGGIIPVKSSMSGVSNINLATGQVHATLSGPSTLGGLTTFEENGQLVPTGPGTFNFFSSWTMTAANGDQMLGDCAGTVTASDPAHFTLRVTCESTSGTGRFADTSLNIDATINATRVSVDPATGIATNALESTAEGTSTRPGPG